MEFVALLAMVVMACVALLRIRSERPVGGRPELSSVARREHALGIRPCSQSDCQQCLLFVARVTAGRHRWSPQAADPKVIEGSIVGVERVPRYGRLIDLYYLDPIGAGDRPWVVEASHQVLADHLSRFHAGDHVRIGFEGGRRSSSTGRTYYLYDVQQLP